MNRLRFSGSACSRHAGRDRRARMTKMSTLLSQHRVPELLRALRRQGGGHRDPALRISRSRSLINSGLMSSADLLHPGGGQFRGAAGDLGEQRLGIGIPRPQALEVEHAEATELPEVRWPSWATSPNPSGRPAPECQSDRRRSASWSGHPRDRACAARASNLVRGRPPARCRGRSRSRSPRKAWHPYAGPPAARGHVPVAPFYPGRQKGRPQTA